MLKRSFYGLLYVIVAVTVATQLFTSSASAHYDLTDPVTGLTAKYHITPDHEPIAGQSSIISFDLSKDDVQNNDYVFVITVSDKTQTLNVATSHTTGNVITADYTFPSAGEYIISLQINSPDGRISSVQQKQSVKAAAATGETAEQDEDESSRKVILLSSTTLALIIIILAIAARDQPKKKRRK